MKNKITMFVVGLIAMSGMAFAATTIDSEWNGGGSFNVDFTAGDDFTAHFDTFGVSTEGNLRFVDSDDNPYSYGVDTMNAFTWNKVTNGHSVFWSSRNDSKSSMYGNAGQYVESGVLATGGWAEMAFGVWTNYASMTNCQYGRVHTTSGKQFEANADYFDMYHTIQDADSNGAYVGAFGSGIAKIKLQGESSQGSAFNMGSLKVCGDNCAWNNNYATFEGNGAGNFNVQGWANHEVEVGCPDCGSTLIIPGDGSENSATYDLTVNYAGNFHYADFGIRGN